MSCALKIFRAQANCHTRNAQSSAQNLNIIFEEKNTSYGEEMRGRYFQALKFDGEKYLLRAESKHSSLANKSMKDFMGGGTGGLGFAVASPHRHLNFYALWALS